MLETIIIGSLFVLGLYASMGEGMILSELRRFFEKVTDNKILNIIKAPLYECPICMASIWGTVVWMVLGKELGAMWVLYVFGVAGFNYIITNLISSDE